MSEADYQYHDVPRAEMVDFVPMGARRVLDVGCGLGGFGAELRRRRPGVHVTGLESDPRAAARAEERYDAMVMSEFPMGVEGRAFDCIVFNDVLEHMVDPWAALRAAASLLIPDGVVVASLPNIRYAPVLGRLVLSREFTYASDGVLDRTHLRFFTGPSARALLVDSGFIVQRVEPINLARSADLPATYRRPLRLLARVRPELATDLRAQQYALVARPSNAQG